ncbi:T9SS outer membrane translocon Sov/SprA [Puia dinghuensis]|uniref:Cell surface protein SprA n=1 Tax=Puia dinghuensis TaxID=1792502 RepID=A0A8J2XW13_9BACT|nr:cell surface protein SprA [Puia dinghuensis]GGB22576.1 cell surface protein SprA [Puia dinghuensis]
MFSTTVSAHPFQQQRDTTAPGGRKDTIAHRTDTVGLSADYYMSLMRRAADSIRRQRDSVRRIPDTARPGDSLRFPIHDRRGDRFSYPNNNPFDLKDPSNLRDSIVYDPATNQYYIIEKVGNQYYRKPTYLTFEEMMKMSGDSAENDYFRKRADALDALNRRLLRPKLSVSDNLFNRIFGNGKIDIRPQGNVDITAGYMGQNIQNPTLPESARRTGGFDFNENANLQVVGNIGDKLKLPISYNTLANFDFENQLKLDYTGGPDEIIKKVEAGNVSFTTPSTLMTGAQSLFGIKTRMQFGKLSVTAVLANQRSQKQTVSSQGGAQVTSFSFKADDYDENRHFLLAQYFRNNYNTAMSTLPLVSSQVQILRIEVWVTNRNGVDTGSRQIVGLMDLGEPSPYNNRIGRGTGTTGLPYNDANTEYRSIINDPTSRSPTSAANKLNSLGLTQVQDFEIVYARKLNATDYYFNPQVGFISVNQTLQANDVLAVAYQYSYNGHIYQVGEFSTDVPPDTTAGTGGGASKVLYLKLLKATSQRTNLPLWNLMMKNVYSLKTPGGSYLANIQQQGFQFNVNYDEPSKGTKRYLPEGPKANLPLLTVLGLDRLNAHNDPGADGIFDYIEGLTVISNQGRIIFPVLEPFGRDLDTLAFAGAPQSLKNKYVFYQLYDTIKAVAQTFANVDRYVLNGTAKGQSASTLSLNAYNVPPGSVVVTAGGQTLRENVDYVVDYNLGQVQIINQAIINSGVPVNVSYENNANFGLQQRSFMGVRLDYLAKSTATESLNIGATFERLNERPFFSKTDYGEDPIRNSMYGTDINYRGQLPQLTRLLDKLPFYSTKEMSTINAYGEGAILKPGHPPQIGSGNSGAVYIDDFEGSTSAIDLRFPLTSWALASTPAVPIGSTSTYPPLFPEGNLSDSLDYGFNRAKLAWYNIEPTLQDPSNPNNPVASLGNVLQDPRVAPLQVQQLFPQQTVQTGQAQLVTFDMAYYPTDRGPYNFDARPGSIAPNGKLNNPKKRWGGIMRALDQTDFETANIEVLQFWVLSPFAKTLSGVGNSTGGQLYVDLGSISEDILKDGKKEFENGLNTPNITAEIDSSSVWGRVPANPIQVTTAFSNNAADRPYQDVGLDGMTDQEEQQKYARYLQALGATIGTGSQAYLNAQNDPSNDNFLNYRDASYDASKTGILGRYKNINNPQGNSPIATAGQTTISAYTLYPDQEDLNKDNTMNTLEQYFEYKVNMTPDSLGKSQGYNFITDSVNFTPSGGGAPQTWYQMTIPLAEYYQNVGNMPDFRSIQFIRMYMTGWSDSVVLRFAQLQLVRNSWRSFAYKVDTTGNMTLLPTSNTSFNVTAVNIEQNSSRQPINYVSPPGVVRQQELSNNNVNLLLNEQAMSLQICNLAQGDVRGVYKTTNLDLRRYGTMDMFVHAEAVVQGTVNDFDMSYVVRLGSDFVSNYYEIRVPIHVTQWKLKATADEVWPSGNNLNLNLGRLIQLKVDRNNKGSTNTYYKETDADGRSYAVLGNPNLGAIQAFFLGVQNVNRTTVCTEVWFNELRLTDISEKGGWAAVGKVDVKLADLGTLTVSGSNKSAGWGTIDQSTNQRSLDNNAEVDAAINIDAGKLLPKKAAISIPIYAGVTKQTSTPEYDPFDLDIKLKDKINAAPAAQKDSIRKQAIDQTTVQTVNFTNVHKNNTSNKKLKVWSIENVNVSYSYSRSEHHSPLASEDELIVHKAILAYNYTRTAKFITPFRKMIKSRSPWLGLVRDFNFNPMPTVLGFQANVNRQFGAYRSRNIGGPDILPESFNKFFTFDRLYTLRWDLTKSLALDFTATNRAWVDEDTGRLSKQGRHQMWQHFWKGGRTILYNQNTNITYTLPTSKLPMLDWTTIKAGYSATYTWTGASLLPAAHALGNTLANTQQRTILADLDFTRLYSKWKLLRGLDQPPPRTIMVGGRQVPDTARRNTGTPPQTAALTGVPKALVKLLTSLKHITFNYADNSGSTIYGFLDSTRALGMNFHSMEPGWAYVFGKRADTNFINKLGKRHLISTDSALNNQNLISYTQKISASATLEPVRDLRISINIDKTFGQNYSELYKDTIGGTGYARLNPYIAGTFNISFISYKTLFEHYRPDQISETFHRFENYRAIISSRLGAINPYTGGLLGSDGYAVGYGRYAQDVLIPAFIAAYTGKSPTTVALINEKGGNVTTNPFSGYLPKPNWHITYNGLSRLPWFSRIFTSFNLTNAYTGNLSMNSFNSNLNYSDPSRYGQPGFIDTLTGNFVPYFQVPNITISEQFSPLLGVDMQFVNLMTAAASYSRSRQLSLSLVDFQLSETHSSELSVTLGYRKKNVGLPFGWKVPGNGKTPPAGPPGSINAQKGSNDLIVKLTVSVRDDAMSSSYLDQNASLPTGGQTVVHIGPTVDYVLNNRINLSFYFDQMRTTPKISTTPPIVTTKGGIHIRISLAP